MSNYYISRFYRPMEPGIWQGREDDSEDRESFRWHQVVEPFNLNDFGSDSGYSADLDSGFDIGSDTGLCFLGFCCDKGVELNKGRRGAARAPLVIRKEMANLPVTFPRNIRLFDAGDLLYSDEQLLETAQEALAVLVERILDLNLFPILMGGGHEIALGHYNGIKKKFTDSIGIINFDAHLDLRPHETSANSGTMFSQIAQNCEEENRRFSYFCVGAQGYGNTVSLFKKADRLKACYIKAKDITVQTVPGIVKQLETFISANDHIYLTLCFDVISSAYAPGVSATQPFGLHPETMLNLLKPVLRSGKVKGFDIAEVSPRFDEDNRTAKLAAIINFAVINTLTNPAPQV